MRENNLVHNDGYLPRQRFLGSSPRVPGHVLEDNSGLPLLGPEGRFTKQTQYRQMSDVSDRGGGKHEDLETA